MTTAVQSAAPSAAPIETVSSGPFKFLDYYVEADHPVFAGRDADIKEVVARIVVDRTFVLYGRSGLGKTSLLLAGVFPALRERGFQPVHVRTLESPLQDLRDAIARAFDIPVPSPDGLSAVLDELDEHGVVVLVFDQFEEFFVRFREAPEAREELVRAIAALAANTALKVRLVFSVREDYLAAMDDLQKEIPGLLGNSYRLQPLTAFGTRQAIAQPLSATGVEYDRRLLVGLVDLLAEVGFDPVMLQIVCTEVYREAVRRDPHHVSLTEQDLRAVGGLQETIRRYLDRVMSDVPGGSLVPSRHILDALITKERTKRAVTLKMLTESDFTGSREEIETILALFVKHRLVRRELRGDVLWYELSHERLAPVVDHWLNLDTSFHDFRVVRDLVTSTCRGELWRNSPGTLLQKSALDDHVARYKERLRLSELELEFVLWSVICAQTDVEYWIKRCGLSKSKDAVYRLLDQNDARARVAAAKAAAVLDDPDGDCAQKLCAVALSDADVDVRRAAGASLAVLGRKYPQQIAAYLPQLKSALADRSTRAAALDVVADLGDLGSRKRFGLRRRWLAKQIIRRRAFVRHEDVIRRRSKHGALTGTVASAVWLLTIGSGLVWWRARISGSDILTVMEIVGWWWAPVVIAAGALLGWRLGRHAAKRASLYGEGRWWAVLARERSHYYAISLLVIWAFLLLYVYQADDGSAAKLAARILLGAFILHLVVMAVTAIAQPTVWPPVSQKQLWSWSLIASVGIPLLLPVLIATAWIYLGGSGEQDADTMLRAAVITGTLISVVTFISVVTLARTASVRPIAPLPMTDRRARVAGRVGGLVAVLALGAWYSWGFGFDSVFAERKQVVPTEPTRLGISSAPWTDTDLFQLRVSQEATSFQRVVQVPENVRVRIDKRDIHLAPGMLLTLPVGSHTVAITHRDGSNAAARELVLEPVTAHPCSKLPSLPPGGWIFVRCTVESDQNAEVWRTKLHGAGINSDRAVRIEPLSDTAGGTQFPSAETATLSVRWMEQIVPLTPGTSPAPRTATSGLIAREETVQYSLASGVMVKVLPALDGQSPIHEVAPNFQNNPLPFRLPPDRPFPAETTHPIRVPVDANGRWAVELTLSANKPPADAQVTTPAVPSRLDMAFALAVVAQPSPLERRQEGFEAYTRYQLLDKNNTEARIRALREAVALDPMEPTYRNALAWTLCEAGRCAEALDHAREAVRGRPQEAEIQDTLAHAAFAHGLWREAADAWDRAVKGGYSPENDPLCKSDRTDHVEARRKARNGVGPDTTGPEGTKTRRR
jgi:hypothetical protein